MPYIVDIQTSFPKHYFEQEVLSQKVQDFWRGKIKNLKRIEDIFENVEVSNRYLAIPIEEALALKSFGEKNKLFIENAVRLAETAITKLLSKADLHAGQINSLWSNTVTGFSIPSLESRLMNLLPFSPDTKRLPMLGLGCMAGAAGINRMAEYLKGQPDQAAIFFSVELCSLTFQQEDISIANIISSALFGDGCAAVLMVGDNHPLASRAVLKWYDSESSFLPDTQDVMGWDVSEKGLTIKLNKDVPAIAREKIINPVNNVLKRNAIEQSNISTYFVHPGGPKVLTAAEEGLGLPEGFLEMSWKGLKEKGNMSSVSILDNMANFIADTASRKTDTYALSVAMGPAFSIEVGLFKWR